MKCPHCQQENHDENIYCTSCGKELEKAEKICSICNTENSNDAVYCVSCGQKLSQGEVTNTKKCTSCGADNPKENLYCVACGSKMYNQQISQTNNTTVSVLNADKYAQKSLVFGIIAASVSVVCCCLMFVAQIVGIVLAIISLVYGVKGLAGFDKTKSIIGIVLSVVAILLSGYMIIEYAVTIAMLASMSEEEFKAFMEQYGYTDFAVVKTYISNFFIK